LYTCGARDLCKELAFSPQHALISNRDLTQLRLRSAHYATNS
jgi:hypothetical protein